jgi:hypothetical protein
MLEKFTDQVVAEESSAAGDECFHARSNPLRSF